MITPCAFAHHALLVGAFLITACASVPPPVAIAPLRVGQTVGFVSAGRLTVVPPAQLFSAPVVLHAEDGSTWRTPLPLFPPAKGYIIMQSGGHGTLWINGVGHVVEHVGGPLVVRSAHYTNLKGWSGPNVVTADDRIWKLSDRAALRPDTRFPLRALVADEGRRLVLIDASTELAVEECVTGMNGNSC